MRQWPLNAPNSLLSDGRPPCQGLTLKSLVATVVRIWCMVDLHGAIQSFLGGPQLETMHKATTYCSLALIGARHHLSTPPSQLKHGSQMTDVVRVFKDQQREENNVAWKDHTKLKLLLFKIQMK